jgi:glycosyltransferase involved in cell wall biosynthesis
MAKKKQNNQPTISVVIPFFNHLDALKQSLPTLAGQTILPHEVIIVDDGSVIPLTDEDLNDFSFATLDIQLIRQTNAGAPTARNTGLDAATGEYIIFWDADVVADATMFERLHAALDANPEASYAYSNMQFGFKKMPAQSYDIDALRRCNYIHSTSLLRKKDAIRWDESLKKFQDWDYWLTLHAQGKTGVHVDAYLHRAIPNKYGISHWLPSGAYRSPWKYLPIIAPRVRRYEEARAVIVQKHHLSI